MEEKNSGIYCNTNVQVAVFDIGFLDVSVDLFINVFSGDPWYDVFDSRKEVMDFFQAFINLPIFSGFQLFGKNNRLLGISLGFIKPWLRDGKLRYEYFLDQFCIDSELQGKGLGQYFMRGIEEKLKAKGINDIILNTGLSSPSFRFYEKIGFIHLSEYGFLSKEL